MATAQAIWGIDLGRCALKAIKLRVVAEDRVEIVASDYVEHPKILSQPDADRHELIRAALEKFLSRNDLSKDDAVVSVPGQHTLARFTKLPPVAPKRIPDIVRYEADQQIPFDMDEVIWDYQTFQQEGMPSYYGNAAEEVPRPHPGTQVCILQSHLRFGQCFCKASSRNI